MSPAAADRPTVAELSAGDAILVADDRLAFVAIIRCITTGPRCRVLHLEVPGLPARTWDVMYAGTEIVERHARRAA